MMTATTLRSPLRGWLAALDEVPDEVFAQRVLGDGVCIDPTGATLHAPCDGEVISLPPSRHAIALRTTEGAELLLHIGIDTVALAGVGFEAHVAVGERVASGQLLITFDLQTVAVKATSLITPIIVTNGEKFELSALTVNREIEVGDALFVVRALTQNVASSVGPGINALSRRVTIGLEHGIHARPAALLAQNAKASDAEVQIRTRDGRSANAKSAVALMSLGLKRGDEIELVATGAAAEQALETLISLLRAPDTPFALSQSKGSERSIHAGRERFDPSISRQAADNANGLGGEASSAERRTDPSQLPDRVRAVIASRGLAVGRAVLLQAKEFVVEEIGRGITRETNEFDRARGEVRARLEHLGAAAHATAKEVIAAHLEFLDDWELVAAARRSIARGKSAAFAWQRAVRDSADTLRALGDSRMTERIDDLLDLESQVLESLLGAGARVAPALPERSIILCDDLKPSQFVALDATCIAGICMASGGPTSHVAILASALGIPMLVAAGRSIIEIDAGRGIVLDAENGVLHSSPDQQQLEAVEQTLLSRQQRKQTERASAQQECRTADGERIEVFANLGSVADVQGALANGAEGCGLLRSEFLFLERSSAPDITEQQREYQAIATALGGRPLIIRTLDIGGDKPIPYLPLPAEENPALGLRGIRTSLWRPDLLSVQLSAILSVQPYAQCRLLLPMITDVPELRAIRRTVNAVCRELGRSEPIQLGAMIETPAAAVLAEQLARECDFLSIGTNDLTQYTLAMDRTHSELAHRIDGLHPAVLRLIEMVGKGAERQHKLVAVCGGLASDPAAVAILIGLGVRELSVVPALIPQIKALVRGLTLESAASLAQAALQLESADAVRALVHQHAQHAARVAS